MRRVACRSGEGGGIAHCGNGRVFVGGTNPTKRAQDDIDVLAVDRVAKQLLIGECKYRESFDETAEIEDLESKRGLVKDYVATNFMLFTKHEVSVATREKMAERADWHFVTLDEMYEG